MDLPNLESSRGVFANEVI